MPGVSNLPGLVKRKGGVAFGLRYRGITLLQGSIICPSQRVNE